MLLVEIEDRKTGVLKMIFLEDFHFFDKIILLKITLREIVLF